MDITTKCAPAATRLAELRAKCGGGSYWRCQVRNAKKLFSPSCTLKKLSRPLPPPPKKYKHCAIIITGPQQNRSRKGAFFCTHALQCGLMTAPAARGIYYFSLGLRRRKEIAHSLPRPTVSHGRSKGAKMEKRERERAAYFMTRFHGRRGLFTIQVWRRWLLGKKKKRRRWRSRNALSSPFYCRTLAPCYFSFRGKK